MIIGSTIDEILEKVTSLDPEHNPNYLGDDKGNGALFADVTGEFARFNADAKLWNVYDGIRWADDKENLQVEGVAQKIATALFSMSINNSNDKFVKDCKSLGSIGTRNNMLRDARNFHAIRAQDLDKDKYLLNVKNGTIELKTITFREHRPEDLLSCVAGADYDPDADCPKFKAFIAQITSVPNDSGGYIDDPDKAEFLQRILGYSLLGDCKEDEFYILYGATTRNGKSTLLDVIGDILGDYAEMIEPEALSQGRVKTANDEQTADLKGKRFAHVEEPSKNMTFDIGLIKKLTGRSKLSASKKYQNRFTFFPEFKIFLATNFLPTVLDDTLFKSGRVKVVTFERHFEEWEQDKGLRATLVGEEASGILNWLLEGLRNYYKKETEPPASVKKATDEYQNVSDRLANFLNECTVEDKEHDETAKDLYSRYQDWCRECGYSAEGKQKFIDGLKRKRLLTDHKNINGVKTWNVIEHRRLVIDGSIFREDDLEKQNPWLHNTN